MASALKNYIDRDFVVRLSKTIPAGKKTDFIAAVINGEWKDLELKQRIRHVSTQLGKFLPGDYRKQIATLKKAAPEFTGLGGLVFPDFVEVHGTHDLQTSLEALKSFTPHSTSEFAIRPFIQSHPKDTMATIKKWAKDSDEHVRRLASEGTRPRLPWSFKLREFVKDPSLGLEILAILKDDDSLYVCKSVANHLNDISKDHPELVLKTASQWIGRSQHTDWILKHALRTLLKKGDQRALKLFGTAKAKGVEVQKLKFGAAKFRIGSALEFSFALNTKHRQKLRLAYAVHYLKKGGQHSHKVFKICEKDFSKGPHAITRRHSLRQMTTRVHYPGVHHLEIIVNGEVKAKGRFNLEP